MAIENDLDLFARIENGKVVEYPVYRIHIRNREHPIHWYAPVIKDEVPFHTKYEAVDESIEITAEGVRVTYKVRLKTLSELLDMVSEKGYTSTEGVYSPPLIGDVEPELVNLIYKTSADYVTDKLNRLAAERGYGTNNMEPFASLMTYYNSKIDKFRIEAVKGADYRDLLWNAMLSYFEKVMAGTAPVPTKLEDIVSQMPAFSWDDR